MNNSDKFYAKQIDSKLIKDGYEVFPINFGKGVDTTPIIELTKKCTPDYYSLSGIPERNVMRITIDIKNDFIVEPNELFNEISDFIKQLAVSKLKQRG